MVGMIKIKKDNKWLALQMTSWSECRWLVSGMWELEQQKVTLSDKNDRSSLYNSQPVEQFKLLPNSIFAWTI